jgi:hypothetical protein
MKTQIVSIMAGCFCAICFCPTRTEATLITTEIEAVVDSVSDEANYLEGKIKPGDIILGFYVYESTTPDSSPLDPVQGNYWHYGPPAGISFTVGGFNFTTDPFNIAFCVANRNDIPPGGGDVYSIGSSNNLPLSNGTPVDSIWWQLNDYTGAALLSDALPTTPPDLSHFQSGNVLCFYSDRLYGVDAVVTSVELIPEPGTVLLFAVGWLLFRKQA